MFVSRRMRRKTRMNWHDFDTHMIVCEGSGFDHDLLHIVYRRSLLGFRH